MNWKAFRKGFKEGFTYTTLALAPIVLFALLLCSCSSMKPKYKPIECKEGVDCTYYPMTNDR